MSSGKNKKKDMEKCLYTCESRIDGYEYSKMAKYFPQIYWSYVIGGTIKNLIITLMVSIASKDFIVTVLYFAIIQAFVMIFYKVRLKFYVEKSFNELINKGKVDTEIHTEFYEEYFIRQGNTESIKINYNDIDKSIETDTNFYLKFGKRNKIIIIQKDSCDLELINFIRGKFKDIENHLGNNSKIKGVKKYQDPYFIRIFMIILFILTLFSFVGAGYSISLVNMINPTHGLDFTKNLWVFWCWLPLPILSIILGIKYNKAGFQCTKNIVGGFIIVCVLLVYGSFSLISIPSYDYSEIDAYRDIIDAELPDNGEIQIIDMGTYSELGKTNHKIIDVYYDKEDISDLITSIENSDNWILSTEIKSELTIFIPSQFRLDDGAYFSIYNKTTNQYNTLPEKSGYYEIYTMKFDEFDKYLTIHKYRYNYK